MRQIKPIRLYGIFQIAMLAIVLHIAGTQQTVFAQDSQTTPPATSGVSGSVDDQRLLKALDALEKTEKALGAALNEIEARKRLDDLKNQYLAVKDMIIAEQDKLIQFYQKGEKRTGFKARLKQILGIAEKIALIALGVSVGRGL